VTRHLEILTQNQQLSKDLNVSQQQIADLLVQNESYQKEIDILESQLEMDAESIRQTEQKKFNKEINKYKSLLEDKDKIIEQHAKEKEQWQKEKLNLVEDTMLFNWMTVAIKLDYTMHNNSSTNFDTAVIYEKLKNERVPYATWPKRILEEIIGMHQINNDTKPNTPAATKKSITTKTGNRDRSKSANVPKEPTQSTVRVMKIYKQY